MVHPVVVLILPAVRVGCRYPSCLTGTSSRSSLAIMCHMNIVFSRWVLFPIYFLADANGSTVSYSLPSGLTTYSSWGVILPFYWLNKTSILHGLPLPSPRTQTARSHFLVLRFPFWLTWGILHDLQPAFLSPLPPPVSTLASAPHVPIPISYLLLSKQ